MCVFVSGFPCGASGKEPACQCRARKRPTEAGFNPWVRKALWRRAWQSTPVLLPGESPWTQEFGRLQFIGLWRVGQQWLCVYDMCTHACTHTYIFIRCQFWPIFTVLHVTSSLNMCFYSIWEPPGSSVHGILQASIWSGLSFPSPGDLPDPGVEHWSSEVQADSLLTELWGKPFFWKARTNLFTQS